jgi:hypothetical protein
MTPSILILDITRPAIGFTEFYLTHNYSTFFIIHLHSEDTQLNMFTANENSRRPPAGRMPNGKLGWTSTIELAYSLYR